MCHLDWTSQLCLLRLRIPASRTLVGGRVGAVDGDVEVAQVLLVRNGADSGDTGRGCQSTGSMVDSSGLGRQHTVRPSGAQSP